MLRYGGIALFLLKVKGKENAMSDLKKMKKDELVDVITKSQETIADLEDKLAAIKVEDSPEDTNAKISNLVATIGRLEGELDTARSTSKFVAIENLSLGRVWLYAPESKSGRPEDREKGRLLKQTGELAIVPSYWMAQYLADRSPSFLMGETRLNNERGRELSPHLVFEDYDLPEEITGSVVPNEDIADAINGTVEEFYDFIETYREKPFILNRIYGVVDRAAHAAPEKSQRKSILDGHVSYIDEIIHPMVEEEVERDEFRI